MSDFTRGSGPLSALARQPKTRFETDPMASYQSPTLAAEAAEAEPEDSGTAGLYRKARETLMASQSTGMDPLTTFLLAASQAGPGGIGAAIGRGGIAAQQAMVEGEKSEQERQLKLLTLGIEEGKYKDTIKQREAEVLARKEEKEAERNFRAEEALKEDKRDFDNQVILTNMLAESRRDVAQITAAPRLEAAANKKPASIEAQDKFYATDLAKWTINGKGVAAEQLSKLDEVTKLLEQNTDVSGVFVGLLPRPLRSEASKNAEDLIGSIVQGDLRQVLGGQFAQKEGESLLKRSYAIDVKEQNNLARVARLRTRILSAIEAKNEMANYFDEHQSMQGYKGKTVDDIYQEMKKDLEETERAVVTPGADKPELVNYGEPPPDAVRRKP